MESDGPSHSLTCRLPVGGSLIGGGHLELLGNDELLGYAIVSLPFWEVYQRKGSDDRKESLRGILHISDYVMILEDCN